MRAALIAAVLLALGACGPVPTPDAPSEPPPKPAETANKTAGYTLVRVCPGGTMIYGPAPFAIWQDGSWVNLDDSTTVGKVC